MSVRLRLQRHGTKKRPFYRLVAADQRSMRDGRCLEIIGTYNPLINPPEFVVKSERLEHWLSQGAQMTDTVRSLVRSHKK
ncbi:MAG: 30S ribosomal protein S16 [Myxococcota bacterium]|jgi:small subunit ribosomal protein S16|nr:30S ribosomal protein S16 [Myxococcota bacterium]